MQYTELMIFMDMSTVLLMFAIFYNFTHPSVLMFVKGIFASSTNVSMLYLPHQ